MISRQRQTATKRACPPVREDNCISPTYSCGRYTAIAGYYWWGCIFFFSFLVCYACKTPIYFSKETTGRLCFLSFFVLFLDICFVWVRWCFIVMRIGGCEGGITASPPCLSLCLAPFFSLLVSFCLPSFLSVSFSINNSWIKLSGNFGGTLCYGRPSR